MLRFIIPKQSYFTGTILNHRFTSNSGRELVIISGYSKCGILEDVCVLEQISIESTNKSLKDIATQLCGYFELMLLCQIKLKAFLKAQ